MVSEIHFLSLRLWLYKRSCGSYHVHPRSSKNLLIAQIYVDDIVFGAAVDSHAHEFASKMKKEIDMNMIGELTYFLGLPSPAI